jgi:DNA-binding NarL/FixJ family response regulator
VNTPQVIHPLTPCECRVVAALAKGEEVRAVANRFGLSPNTVWAQLGIATRKLGIHNRASLTLEAIRRGYIPCPCKHSSKSKVVAA